MMRFALVFALVTFVAVNADAERTLRYIKRYDNDQKKSDNDFDGYSAGSGLRSIAHGSANRAFNAAVNQRAAGERAAYLARSSLAQEAVHASNTVQAVLAGKQVLYQGLQKQVAEAEDALEAEAKQVKLAENAAKATKGSADIASQQIASIEKALKNAKSAAKRAREAVKDADAALAKQSSTVDAAQKDFDGLKTKLDAAEVDYEETKRVAENDSISAQNGKENVSASRESVASKVIKSPLTKEEVPIFKYEVPEVPSLRFYLHHY